MPPARTRSGHPRVLEWEQLSEGAGRVRAMPSPMHEVLNELVKDRPAVIADLLTELFKLDLPAWRRVRVDSGEFTEVMPTEYRARHGRHVHRRRRNPGAGRHQRDSAAPRP